MQFTHAPDLGPGKAIVSRVAARTPRAPHPTTPDSSLERSPTDHDTAAPSPASLTQALPHARGQQQGRTTGQTGRQPWAWSLPASSSSSAPHSSPAAPWICSCSWVQQPAQTHRHTESFIQGCISASNSLEPLKCCLGAPASLFILLCPAGTSFAFLCPAISQKLCYKTSTGPRAMNRSLFVEVTFFCFLSFFFFSSPLSSL